MKNIFLSLSLLFFIGAALQAEGITQFGTPTHQKQFPKGKYVELPNHTTYNAEEWKNEKKLNVAWGTTDIRYPKQNVPAANKKSIKLNAWKGESVSAQLLVWGTSNINGITCEISDFKSNDNVFKSNQAQIGFVRYVMTDELNKDKKGACGHRPDITIFDSSLVADPIDHLTKKIELKAHTVQPIWIRINIPSHIAAGTYTASVSVNENETQVASLPIEIKVGNRTLPSPKDWKFHLDLWQNPFAEARYFEVEPWSESHLKAMRPSMKLLADAGQKVITASIMYKPWGGQTQDHFSSMVTWLKKLDGTWAFDFAVFDRWVEYMMDLGIDRQINCYSMIPWSRSFRYFDQASDEFRTLEADPGNEEYNKIWTAMLKSFAAHLKEKGWFEKTTIAMDERPKEFMQAAFKIIKDADNDFKVSLAGEWHQELESELYDYCIAFKHQFPQAIASKRKAEGKISTYYTCCTEPYPNMFTFSSPAEAEWLGWYAAAKGFDGYLRWAYNSYTLEPLLDSRFRSFAAGDCYLAYPEGRSSIRMERLREGIQAFEKIQILRTEFERSKNIKKRNALEKTLETFSLEELEKNSAQVAVQKARVTIDLLSR